MAKIARTAKRPPAKTRTKAKAEPRGRRRQAVQAAAAAIPPAKPYDVFPIVGIGASAGGLEAMTQLLKHVPAHCGMALVLVQHLDPTHESALPSILARSTSMLVVEAKNNMQIVPNKVFVIPPNKLMGITERRLRLSPRSGTSTLSSIDHFMRSLAAEEGTRAIGVVLSGSGSDGTQGLLAIKAAGGITFAQDEKSARYPAMPASAITAGCVDFVLPPERIARELTRVAGHPYIRPVATETEEEEERPEGERAFDAVLVILRQRTGVDFAQYKHATLRRRIQRRMLLNKFESLKEYGDYLRSHPGEVQELYHDILIHVTGFFRDPAVFQVLKKKILPRLVRHKSADEALRIWVPGCSTGEEVYSIAIVAMEAQAPLRRRRPVQIFGTDINEVALEKARAGVYSDHIKADVSGERLRRFFVKSDLGYRINKTIREMCIFARQNLMVDPPFPNIDLISCRNVLIYLGPSLQRKVLPLFHYALRPDGYLVLGASETIGSHGELFSLVDKKAKVYEKLASRTRPNVVFGSIVAEPLHAGNAARAARPVVAPSIIEAQHRADRIVMNRFAPAGVIINRHLEVLQFRGKTGPFLEHAHGEASLNLLKMAREGLVANLRTLVHRAMKHDLPVRQQRVRVRDNGKSAEINLEVVPFNVPPATEKLYLVLFEPATAARAQTAAKSHGPARAEKNGPEGSEVRRLRDELAATRESLQTIVEEQEATNEEARSANEEIMSANEELQSTNEELETAKEELQSTNEELTTLNEELENRNAELHQVNNDLHNLLASVNIPVILLGLDLRIRRYTTVAEQMFNLLPGDVGRPITDLSLPLDIPDLAKLVLEVIDRLMPRDIEVKSARGRWLSVRIRPYKTTDNKIDGAVLAVLDTDVLKSGLQHISQSGAFAGLLDGAVGVPVIVLDANLTVQFVNGAYGRAFGATADDLFGRSVYDVEERAWDDPRIHHLLEEVLRDNTIVSDYEVEREVPGAGKKKLTAFGVRLARHGDRNQLSLLWFNGAPTSRSGGGTAR